MRGRTVNELGCVCKFLLFLDCNQLFHRVILVLLRFFRLSLVALTKNSSFTQQTQPKLEYDPLSLERGLCDHSFHPGRGLAELR